MDDKTTRVRLQDLEAEYEEARQEWNATNDHEKRIELSDRMNEIRETQYDIAAETNDDQ